MKYFITGGLGFIGSNLTKFLLDNENKVTIYDNFTNGKLKYLGKHINSPSLQIINSDTLDFKSLLSGMKNHEIVVHLAANADIAKSALETDLDLKQTILATYNVLESMRINSIKNIIYSSGSGVYGDIGTFAPEESYGPLKPVSMYGATKLGAEALISSFSYLFGFKSIIFRFANVIGPNQTHGVAYDFIHKLRSDSQELNILGNGLQSKSYIHVEDIITAIMKAIECSNDIVNVYNLGTGDYITVKEIADLVIENMNLKDVAIKFGKDSFGWKGDVPIVRLNDSKIRRLGWENKYNTRQAMIASIKSMLCSND